MCHNSSATAANAAISSELSGSVAIVHSVLLVCRVARPGRALPFPKALVAKLPGRRWPQLAGRVLQNPCDITDGWLGVATKAPRLVVNQRGVAGPRCPSL